MRGMMMVFRFMAGHPEKFISGLATDKPIFIPAVPFGEKYIDNYRGWLDDLTVQ